MLETPGARTPQFSQPAQPAMFPKSPGAGPQDPGEFTRMLESPFAAKGLAAQPLASAQPRPAPVAPPVGEPGSQQGPSEFTKMFKTPAPPPEPVEKPVKKPAGRVPIARRKKTNSTLWIVIGVVVLVALALVLYFALAR